MNYDKSPKETEYLSADEQKLREMCRSLKKTDAPPDFDFKLKARIASASPSDFKPRFGFAFRYGIPALAVILVLGLLAIRGTFFSSGNNPMVADSAVAPQNPATPPQTEAVSNFVPPDERQPESMAAVSNTNVAKTPEKPQAQVADLKRPKKDSPKTKNEPGGGSKLLSLREDKTGQLNFNSNSVEPNSQNMVQANPIPVKEILSRIGVNADLENGKWKVKSVRANSPGESSDIKENDIIEAIDNQPASTETIKGNSSGARTLTVTRRGERLQIPLRGRQ